MLNTYGKIGCLLALLCFQSAAWASCPNKYFKEACSCEPPANGYCIASGNKGFTYYRVAENLQNIVAPDAGFSLKALPGGSIKNIQRMRWQNGVKFAIVQSDVMVFYKGESKNGNEIAEAMVQPLRVILPLHDEELHILTLKNSPINTFSDLKDKKIALGHLSGGSAMSGRAIYQYMFDQPMSRNNEYYTPDNENVADDSLKALVDGKVDAWVMVVGQHTQRFNRISANAKDLIRLVAFDETKSSEQMILEGPYFSSTIKKTSYPWLEKDIPTIAVKAFLITQRYTNVVTRRNITEFTQSLCKNFERFNQASFSGKQSIQLNIKELPGGWLYSDDALTAFESSDCNLQVPSDLLKAREVTQKKCQREEEALGLCVPE